MTSSYLEAVFGAVIATTSVAASESRTFDPCMGFLLSSVIFILARII
jgi:hypothetical protein